MTSRGAPTTVQHHKCCSWAKGAVFACCGGVAVLWQRVSVYLYIRVQYNATTLLPRAGAFGKTSHVRVHSVYPLQPKHWGQFVVALAKPF
jgi:hypothetical protein